MTDLDRAFGCAAGVVTAGMVSGINVGAAIGLRSGQDVVLVRLVAGPLHRLALFAQGRGPAQVAAKAGAIQRIAMQMFEIARHHGALGVMPGAAADPVAGMDRRLAIDCLGAEIGAPGPATGPRRTGQRLAMRIGTGETTQVGPLAETGTGDEKAQGGQRLGRGGGLLGKK